MSKEIFAKHLVLSIEIHPNQAKVFQTAYGKVLPQLQQAITNHDKTAINLQLKQLEQAARNSYISFNSVITENPSQEKITDANTFKLVIELKQKVSSQIHYAELLNSHHLQIKQVNMLSQITQQETHTTVNQGLRQAKVLKNDSKRLHAYTAQIIAWLSSIQELALYSSVLPVKQSQAILSFSADFKGFAKAPGYNLTVAIQLLQEVIDFCHLVHEQINAQLEQAVAQQANWIAEVITPDNVKCLSNDKLQICNQLLAKAETSKQLGLAEKTQLVSELTSFNNSIFPLLQAKPNPPTAISNQVLLKSQPSEALAQPALKAHKQQSKVQVNTVTAVPAKQSLLQRLGNWFIIAKNWLANLLSNGAKHDIKPPTAINQKQPLQQHVYREQRFTPGRSLFSQKQLIIQDDSTITAPSQSASHQPG